MPIPHGHVLPLSSRSYTGSTTGNWRIEIPITSNELSEDCWTDVKQLHRRPKMHPGRIMFRAGSIQKSVKHMIVIEPVDNANDSNRYDGNPVDRFMWLN